MSRRSPGPQLAALHIADPAHAWTELGFSVDADGVVVVGGVELWLEASGRGITGWTLRGLARPGDVDGLPTGLTTDPPPAAGDHPHPPAAGDHPHPPAAGDHPHPPAAGDHPNGALGIDQVVVTTPDFDRTAAALEAAGMPLRRVVDAGGFRQGFRRLGPAILELVEVVNGPPGPARFWGLVVIVDNLYALRARLGPVVGDIRDAVQPGRHIAAVGNAVKISPRLAFMDPEPS